MKEIHGWMVMQIESVFLMVIVSTKICEEFPWTNFLALRAASKLAAIFSC